METTIEERLVRIETRQAIEDLNTDFCHCLDFGKVDELVDLFTEDAHYSHGKRVNIGRDEIRALFTARTAEQERTSRHLQTGLKISVVDAEKATGTSVCLTFACDGPPPITPATPLLVADFIDEYRLCSDRKWRIARRHIERIFTAAGNAGPVGLKEGK